MFIRLIILLLIVAGISFSCARLKPESIEYNKELGLYAAKDKPNLYLRHTNGKLVTQQTFSGFIGELASNDFYYQWELSNDEADKINKHDLETAEKYANLIEKIDDKEYSDAVDISNELTKNQHNIYFSDIHFITGYCYLQQGDTLNALASFQRFLMYSGGKYPASIRGYKYNEQGIETWKFERTLANQFLQSRQNNIRPNIFVPIIPKYHYQSNWPGFTVNPDQLNFKHRKYRTGLFLNYKGAGNWGLGVSAYRFIWQERASLRAIGIWGLKDQSLSFAIPVQVVKSKSNRFGIKFTPFITTVYNQRFSFHEGFQISSGYSLNSKLGIAGFSRYVYNRQNRRMQQDIWEVAGYFHLFSKMSLKTGLAQNGWVSGLFLSGTSVQWNWTRNRLELLVNFY